MLTLSETLELEPELSGKLVLVVSDGNTRMLFEAVKDEESWSADNDWLTRVVDVEKLVLCVDAVPVGQEHACAEDVCADALELVKNVVELLTPTEYVTVVVWTVLVPSCAVECVFTDVV